MCQDCYADKATMSGKSYCPNDGYLQVGSRIQWRRKHVRFTPESGRVCGALAHVCFGPKADISRRLLDCRLGTTARGIFVAEFSLEYFAGFFARQCGSKFDHA